MKKIAGIISRVITCYLVLVMTNPVNAQFTNYNIVVNTIVTPPVDLFLNKALSTSGRGITVNVINNSDYVSRIRIIGELNRIAPTPFSIKLKASYRPAIPIILQPHQPTILTNTFLEQAFGNFNQNSLDLSGIEFDELRDGLNYKLPEGVYTICLHAVNYNDDTVRSVLQGSCPTFNLCNKAAAPQFTQPVNNMNLNSSISSVKAVSPIVFTWTPPQSTCGLTNNNYTYEFEIREIFANQTITDAVNNPYVFRKTSLPSTTFLLDLNLFKNVLQQGKKYIIRVRAINRGVLIDNNGYSRVEAFQYGENNDSPVTLYGPIEPENYYIPFAERHANYWDDVFNAYSNGTRGDTLVPIKQYIGLKLMQNGIAYNLDAIELFLYLNQELLISKLVKISNKSRMPVLPKVSEPDRQKFDVDHAANLQPNAMEANKYAGRLDSLNAMQLPAKLPDSTLLALKSLIKDLNEFKPGTATVNRVSMSFINDLVSTLLFDLRSELKSADNSSNRHLQQVISDLREFTIIFSGTSSFNFRRSQKTSAINSLNQSRFTEAGQMGTLFSFANNSYKTQNNRNYLPPPANPLLPLDVVVYQRKNPPSEPVINAPDLTGMYRIYYTVKSLYNYRNPEVNAKSLSRLASTTNVSLPLNSAYQFWTLDILNRKVTKPQDVDIKDIYLKAKKAGADKKLAIVLKVD